MLKVSPSVKVNLLLTESELSSNSTMPAPPSENEVAEAIIAVAPEVLPSIVVPTASNADIFVSGKTRITVLLVQLPSEVRIIYLFGYTTSAVSPSNIRIKIL